MVAGGLLMEQVKIGKFIQEMRKAQSLTQRELAEKLNISDKTVSKWETGNGKRIARSRFNASAVRSARHQRERTFIR